MLKKHTFLDPIHGSIELNTKYPEEKLILDLIECAEFQRLRRIRQLGFSYLTFYGAESSRFVHSVGTFQTARLMLKRLMSKNPELVKPFYEAILVSALLHDLGHGPFSHSSEPSFGFEHEDWTINNIKGKTEVNQVLNAYSTELPQKVIDILQQKINPKWVSQIISGQLDCDRCDYLIRDSHQTGTKYGIFQIERIIQSLELIDLDGEIKLIVNEKGIHAVEDYLFARYSMYLQVYHHKKTLAADAMFTSLICRLRDLIAENENIEISLSESLRKWVIYKNNKNNRKNKISLQDFFNFDDSEIISHLKLWSKQKQDLILQDLANRILNRKLFKAQKADILNADELAEIQNYFPENLRKYYCLIHECHEFPYTDKRKPILVRKGGEIMDLALASPIAKALMNRGQELDTKWIFFPDGTN
jgi:uncharacterized protein